MSPDDDPFRIAIIKLKEIAGDDRVVTTEDVVEATDYLPADMIDIDAIDRAINDAGLVWEDPNPGPPVFPPGYAGPKLVKNDPDPTG